ncbi:MAG TPA: ABC transporter permease subunit [Stellaceae bacterium]|nr:ABC transporter permease subunit [Stellaceae bacterium]
MKSQALEQGTGGGEARPRARRVPRNGAGALVLQGVVLVVLALFAAFIIRNVVLNVARLNIHMGFAFLSRPAGFEIAQHLVDYSARSTYGAALEVATLNTLAISAASCALATILGFVIGLLRLSKNQLVSTVALAYVEVVRNVPLLLQLFFWYFAVLGTLPLPRQSLGLFGAIYLNRRGLYIPALQPEAGFAAAALALALGIAIWVGCVFLARRHPSDTGGASPLRWVGPASLVVLLVLARLLFGAPLAVDTPQLEGFNFHGGALIIPEFLAMLAGLSIFGAAFVAELVRGGVLAVPRGQTEAALALGLRGWPINTRIVLPQAMRIILPPLITQYISILKNSSLGAAIAYPELMLVSGTVLNQTGQPIDLMAVTMAIYLALCLGIAAIGNAINRRFHLAAP